jgi:hypothetical protein
MKRYWVLSSIVRTERPASSIADGVLDKLGLRRRVKSLELELSTRHSFVLGKSRAMAEAHDTAKRAAASDATICSAERAAPAKKSSRAPCTRRANEGMVPSSR